MAHEGPSVVWLGRRGWECLVRSMTGNGGSGSRRPESVWNFFKLAGAESFNSSLRR